MKTTVYNMVSPSPEKTAKPKFRNGVVYPPRLARTYKIAEENLAEIFTTYKSSKFTPEQLGIKNTGESSRYYKSALDKLISLGLVIPVESWVRDNYTEVTRKVVRFKSCGRDAFYESCVVEWEPNDYSTIRYKKYYRMQFVSESDKF